MFARSQRLRKNSDILRVYKRGNRAYTNHLKLHYVVNPRGTRVAVVVSKKVDKRAVIRNTAKRRVRELIREELKVLSLTQFDIIVTIQTSLINVSVSELRSEVRQLLGRMR
ncbi:ribonuclease P protein component [bacterium]|nr:MAG: ribonuclease P protein component [bacterium]